MTKPQQVIERGKEVLIGNYARQPVGLVRGSGAEVWDVDGKRYIDLFAGFGGAILGHCHPDLVRALDAQARQLWHVGNSFYTEPQIELAERLSRHAFAGQAFFCHSGMEANEAACKLARLYGRQFSPNRWKVVTLNRSFHGRSLAMISATGNPKIKAGFEPMVPGFSQVDGGDVTLLDRAVDPETAAIMLEPIQGEGGVNVYPAGYLEAVRNLCDERKLLLIFDEVWTGCGRTGQWFAHQHYRAGKGIVEPDIMTLGKAIGGGLPVGAMFARPDVAKLMTPGTHGCTLGGNAVCTAVSARIFDIIERDHLLEHAAAMGQHAMTRLRKVAKIAEKVAEVRGLGLMLGIELREPPDRVVEKGLERGVIMNLTAQKVIRLAPPINITRALWEEGLDLVIDAIAAA